MQRKFAAFLNDSSNQSLIEKAKEEVTIDRFMNSFMDLGDQLVGEEKVKSLGAEYKTLLTSLNLCPDAKAPDLFTLDQNSIKSLNLFVDKLVAMACLEILDENGNVDPRIAVALDFENFHAQLKKNAMDEKTSYYEKIKIMMDHYGCEMDQAIKYSIRNGLVSGYVSLLCQAYLSATKNWIVDWKKTHEQINQLLYTRSINPLLNLANLERMDGRIKKYLQYAQHIFGIQKILHDLGNIAVELDPDKEFKKDTNWLKSFCKAIWMAPILLFNGIQNISNDDGINKMENIIKQIRNNLVIAAQDNRGCVKDGGRRENVRLKLNDIERCLQGITKIWDKPQQSRLLLGVSKNIPLFDHDPVRDSFRRKIIKS